MSDLKIIFDHFVELVLKGLIISMVNLFQTVFIQVILVIFSIFKESFLKKVLKWLH